MKQILIIITGLLLSIATYAQKHIIVAFDVTYSMVKDGGRPVRANRWDPAIQDLENIFAAANPNDYFVVIPFQNQDATWIRPIKGYKSALHWENVKNQLEGYINLQRPYQKNTSIEHAWNLSRAEFPQSGLYEFYLITDGDEDHDNNRDVISASEKAAINRIQQYISSFRGMGYYSSLNSVNNGLPKDLDIFNDLYKSDYFKMKVPGKWDTSGEFYIKFEDLISSSKTIHIDFRPIGSIQGKQVDFSGVSSGTIIPIKGLTVSQDKYVQISNVSSSSQLNKLSLEISVRDLSEIECKDSEGYAFKTRIYNEWATSGKYVIYDKFLDICILRPEPIKADVSSSISYTLKNGVLAGAPEVELMLKDNLLKKGLNIRNVKLVNNNHDVKITLKGDEIKDGKAVFVLDAVNSKFMDGESEFQIELIHEDGQAFLRYSPIPITVKINSENDKTIFFESNNNGELKLRYRKGLLARVDTSEVKTIEYTLSDYLKSNVSTISPQIEFIVESSSSALEIWNSGGQIINDSRINLEDGYEYRFTLNQDLVRRGDKFNVKIILVNTDGIEQVLYKRKACERDAYGNYIIRDLEIKAKQQLGLLAWLIIGLLGLLSLIIAAFAIRRALAPMFAKNHQFAFKTTNPQAKNFTFPIGQEYTQGNALEVSKARNNFIRHFVLYNQNYVKHLKVYGPLDTLWNGVPKYVNTNFEQYDNIIEKIVITPRAGSKLHVKIHYVNHNDAETILASNGFIVTPWIIPNATDITINYGQTATPNDGNN